jgi:ABC-type enterochelin transport system permease subunit
MHSAMAERTTAVLVLLPPEVPMWKMMFCAFIFSLLFTMLLYAAVLAIFSMEFVINVTLLYVSLKPVCSSLNKTFIN